MTRTWRKTWGQSGPRQSSCPDPSICCQSKPALSLRWRAKLTLTMIVKVWLTHRKCKQWYFQDSLIISESLCLSNYWFVLLDFAFTPIDRSVIVLDWQSSKLYVRGEKWFILWSHQLFQTLFHCLVQNQPSPVIPWIPADVSGHQVGTIIGLTAACSVDNGIENGNDNTLNLMFPICNLFSSNLVIVQAKDGWEQELMDESGLGSLPVCVVSLLFFRSTFCAFFVHLFPFFIDRDWLCRQPLFCFIFFIFLFSFILQSMMCSLWLQLPRNKFCQASPQVVNLKYFASCHISLFT